MHGKGHLILSNGDCEYSGDFINDKRHGHGIMTWPDGRQFDGQWFNGKQEGEGNFTNTEGISRRGTWKDGQRVCWID